MDFEVGDEIVTKPHLYHHGEDVGERMGEVVDTHSYIVIELYDYDDNPVK